LLNVIAQIAHTNWW